MKFSVNKSVIVVVGSIIVIVIGIISLFILKPWTSNPAFTGSSGEAQAGSLILRGYETPSNDSAKIPVGEFLTSDQQRDVRLSLEQLLYEKEQRQGYVGTITAGSVEVNYETNIIQFKVKIEQPAVTYDVTYNTVSEEIQVKDSEK